MWSFTIFVSEQKLYSEPKEQKHVTSTIEQLYYVSYYQQQSK
jgi:hypothetical protein